jgi:hypothetical protein
MGRKAVQEDARIQQDHTLAVVMLLLGGGSAFVAVWTIAHWGPDTYRLLDNNLVRLYTDAVLLLLLEVLLCGMAVLLLGASVRHFSTRFTSGEVTQLHVYRFRRVRIPWGEVTGLKESKDGALRIKSPSKKIVLGGGLQWKDPAGLIAFLEERVRPEVKYVKDS